ncbi:MAG TPA: hypothetical protein VF142_00185 [Longimicrobium sp.]
MSRFPRLIAAVAVTILLAACGQAGDNPVGPAGPSLDGGITIGGGNNTQPDTTTNTGSEQEGTSAEAGGITIGGGN